jgi:Fe-S-cluster containining protein
MRFECKRCGSCCRWKGYVYTTTADIKKAAAFLGIDERTLVNQYVDVEQKPRMNLKTKSNGDCIFLEENNCKIYPARPWQCQSFPQYWRVPELEILCPGIKKD